MGDEGEAASVILSGLGALERSKHVNSCLFCLMGLPSTMAEADSSRVAIGFYTLGTLDLLGLLYERTKESQRQSWKEWIWGQQVSWNDPDSNIAHPDMNVDTTPEEEDGAPDRLQASYAIGGFRPGPFMDITGLRHDVQTDGLEATPKSAKNINDPPHLIMTYTALLSLAILRDDFQSLDRKGLIQLLRASQRADGSFTSTPGQGEADLRTVYTAFAISAMVGDWSGVDVPRAIGFIHRCMTYEGGYGQQPGNEAQGGPTYCALASLALAPPQYASISRLPTQRRRRAIRWLIQQVEDAIEYDGDDGKSVTQRDMGGFGGRTNKPPDVCYSFWCGAALRILCSGIISAEDNRPTPTHGESYCLLANGDGVMRDAHFVDRLHHAKFLSLCQFKMGGLSKYPGEAPDPYHTYLGLAALSMYPPPIPSAEDLGGLDEKGRKALESWQLNKLEPLINATEETAQWARQKISGKS